MKKILFGLVMMSSVSAFADVNCGQTWSMSNRYYMDGKDGMTDVEVLIPEHAEKNVLKHFKSHQTLACLHGKFVKVGAKEVFIAVGIED